MTIESGSGSRRKRRWIRIAILVFIAGTLLFLADRASLPIYRSAMLAQNAADGAALAGLVQLARLTHDRPVGDNQIAAEMLNFAIRNGLSEDDHLVGYYLDAEGCRLGLVGAGIPQEPRGIEAVATVGARALGLVTWPVTRKAEAGFTIESANGERIPKMQLLDGG